MRKFSSAGRKQCPEFGRNRNHTKKVVCRKHKRRSAIPREKPCKDGVVGGKAGAPCLKHPRTETLEEQKVATKKKKKKSTAKKAATKKKKKAATKKKKKSTAKKAKRK
jgi:hypothetical protein